MSIRGKMHNEQEIQYSLLKNDIPAIMVVGVCIRISQQISDDCFQRYFLGDVKNS